MRQLPALLLALGLSISLPWPAQAANPAVNTVPQVDLSRYLGTWYEIAHLPQFFQRHCLSDTTAQYSLRDDGRLRVLNRCRTAEGWQQAEGKASVVAGSGNARLKVSFFWPFSGNYWIIGLDPQYRWAVVGDPGRKYLWILSRTPVLPADGLQQAQQAAMAQGYSLSGLLYTAQTSGPVTP